MEQEKLEYEGIPATEFKIPEKSIRFIGKLVGMHKIDPERLKCYFISRKGEAIALIGRCEMRNGRYRFGAKYSYYDFVTEVKLGSMWICRYTKDFDGILSWKEADSCSRMDVAFYEDDEIENNYKNEYGN